MEERKMKKTVFLVQLSLFVAIELIFCFFKPLGSIPITPGIVATLAHIPALIAALALGVYAAGFVGFVMGISSFIVWTFMPSMPAAAFAFTPFAPYGNIFSLIICILPRAAFPVITALIHGRLKNRVKLPVSAAISAAAGTFMHSFLVHSKLRYDDTSIFPLPVYYITVIKKGIKKSEQKFGFLFPARIIP
jgi:uncharacterized membrane protein